MPVLTGRERWVGPFRVRDMLARCLDDGFPKPPKTGSAYLVTIKRWVSHPDERSGRLYVGGNVGASERFRTRIGDLLADAFGFFTDKTGHSSGGQSLHHWCKEHHVNPLTLYVAWVLGTDCHRCLEVRLFRELSPRLNKVAPSKCSKHSRED